jgi:hypothetical protein
MLWRPRQTHPIRIGEMSMRHRRGLRRTRPACRFLQSNLFDLAIPVARPDPAVWWALPEAARRNLIDLLARLLLEHQDNRRQAGGRHDR